jgi:hypothetical protein
MNMITCDDTTRRKAEEIASKTPQGRTYRWTISQYLQHLPHNEMRKDTLFRRRTASQIISDGFVTGCSDRAILFLAIDHA